MKRCPGWWIPAALSLAGPAVAAAYDGGKVFYTGKTGLFSKTSEYKVDARSSNLQVYAGNDTLLFDSKTFALVHLKSATDSFDPAIESAGRAGVLEIGNTWTAAYKQPPTRSATCDTPSDQTFEATVVAKEVLPLEVAGVRTEVEVVAVRMTGTWSSCGYRGTWKALRKYAPSLGLLTLTDSETLLDGRTLAAGTLRIDHIER